MSTRVESATILVTVTAHATLSAVPVYPMLSPRKLALWGYAPCGIRAT